MEAFGLEDARKILYKSMGNYEAAGILHIRDGELQAAVLCFLESKESKSRSLAIDAVLKGIRLEAFGVDFDESSRSLLHQLQQAKDLQFTLAEQTEVHSKRTFIRLVLPSLMLWVV